MSGFADLTDEKLAEVIKTLRNDLRRAKAERTRRRRRYLRQHYAELRAKGWKRHVGIFGIGGWLVEHPTLGNDWRIDPGPGWRRVAFRSPSEAKRKWECSDEDIEHFWRKPAGE